MAAVSENDLEAETPSPGTSCGPRLIKEPSSTNSSLTLQWLNTKPSTLMSLGRVMEQRPSIQGERTNLAASQGYARKSGGKRKPPLQRLLNSNLFDIAIGFVILLNSVCMGFEQHFRRQEIEVPAMEVIEQIFLFIYISEICLRFAAFGTAAVKDNWVKFDIFLVAVGATSSWIVEPLLTRGNSEAGVSELSQILVLRSVRLFRLARIVRLLAKFKELWMLVSGLLSSANTMAYTMFLLFVIVFIFSSIGFELITENKLAKGPDADPDFKAVVDEYFPSLFVTMLTLIQFICMDSIGAIYKPLIQKDTNLILYFAALIIVVPIVLMNLVTAVIVNGAFEQAMADKEATKLQQERHRSKLLKKLVHIFRRLDKDNSGSITRSEISNVDEEDMQVIYESTDITNPLEVFDALDIDGDGNLGIEEFTDGIWQFAVSKSPLETQRMQKEVKAILKRQKEQERGWADLIAVVDDMRRENRRAHDATRGFFIALARSMPNFSLDDLDANKIGRSLSVPAVDDNLPSHDPNDTTIDCVTPDAPGNLPLYRRPSLRSVEELIEQTLSPMTNLDVSVENLEQSWASDANIKNAPKSDKPGPSSIYTSPVALAARNLPDSRYSGPFWQSSAAYKSVPFGPQGKVCCTENLNVIQERMDVIPEPPDTESVEDGGKEMSRRHEFAAVAMTSSTSIRDETCRQTA